MGTGSYLGHNILKIKNSRAHKLSCKIQLAVFCRWVIFMGEKSSKSLSLNLLAIYIQVAEEITVTFQASNLLFGQKTFYL